MKSTLLAGWRAFSVPAQKNYDIQYTVGVGPLYKKKDDQHDYLYTRWSIIIHDKDEYIASRLTIGHHDEESALASASESGVRLFGVLKVDQVVISFVLQIKSLVALKNLQE